MGVGAGILLIVCGRRCLMEDQLASIVPVGAQPIDIAWVLGKQKHRSFARVKPVLLIINKGFVAFLDRKRESFLSACHNGHMLSAVKYDGRCIQRKGEFA